MYVKVCQNILDCIGNTPIIKLSRVVPSDVKAEIWGKMEFLNPTGSVKDRMAYYMIKKAMDKGELKPGMTLVVPTTGNTGIAFSAIGSFMGFKVLIVIPEEMSAERFMLMKLFGADFLFTPGGESDAGLALETAKKLAAEHPDKYYFFDQWSDDANVQAHYETTGKEILQQVGCPDAFVAQVGTGGTLVGVAKRLKEECRNVIVVGAEPAECPVATYWFKEGKPGPWGRHEIEGVGDGFVPDIIARYKAYIDDFVTASSEEAIEMARKIARLEGLPVGISSGANVVSAIKVARKYNFKEGSKIVTILPDYAARYFSTRLFKKRREIAKREELLRELGL
ncbi:PLP-dependent cysteine synthase family protein [Thermogladius sp. 4427co]|uniref:PLP-dependent cysteine synthase family protein n=1 Tax=Thermogladius sp. 4427co TaxID=3450718 RepID=UPI003F7A7661